MVSLENAQGRGTTASRPASPVVGAEYFDTDLNKRVRWSGTAWEDAERSLGTTSTTAAAGNHTHTLASGDIPNNAANTSGTSGATNALKSATTTVNVSSATAPTTGQALVATGPSAATWQTLASGFSNPMTTVDDLIIGGASGAAARLAKGTDGQVLTVDATTHHLAWQTPSAGASGTAGGDLSGTYPNPTLANSSTARTNLGLGSAATSAASDFEPALGNPTSDGYVLSSSAAGVRLWVAQSAVGFANPMTTAGDLILGGASGAAGRLAKGSDSQFLLVDPSSHLPVWHTLAAADVPTLNQDTTGKAAKADALNSATTVVSVSAATAPTSGQVLTATSGTAATWQTPASGGMADPMTTAGDLIIRNGSNVTARLPKGSDTQVLTLVSGVPAWQAPAAGGMTNPMTAGGDLIIGQSSGNKDAARAGTPSIVASSGTTTPAAGVAANLNDGDDSSFVRTSDSGVVTGSQMKVNLGTSPPTVDRFRLLQTTTGNSLATAYVIESSSDDTTYTTRHTVSATAPADTGVVTLSSGAITAQYWRARATAGGILGWQVYTFALITPTVAGSGTAIRLAGGTDGQSLIYDTLQANNLKWGTPPVSNGLASATTTVNTSAATAPSAGQALIATDSTHMTWTAALKSLGAQTIGTTQVAITHSLGYTPTVCIAQMTSAGQIWRSAASSSTQVFLTADAAGRTCEVYVR